MHFLTFDVQPCVNCICDVLYIYNGVKPEPEREIRRLCDNFRPSLFMTSLPGAYLRFISDESVTKKGFKIEYEIVLLAGEFIISDSSVIMCLVYSYT